MVRRALLVGCTYPGEKIELKGSVNDVERMRILLINRFGFNPNEILELVDVDPRARQPTGANIRKCLRKLIDGVEPGDVLFFHFSGHGTQVPSEWGRSDETGYEECIVPSDMNLLTDDDFRELVDRIPRGVNFTFIADACHSGGLIDSEKEQIGDGYLSGRRVRPPGSGRSPVGGGGLMELVGEGIEGYASAGGRGRNDPIMNVVGQALGSRFNRMPGNEKNREFDPQEIDAYGRTPESPYERRYVEGGMPEYPTERPYERRDPREVETGSYEDGGSGYPAGYERRETRGSDRPYPGNAYTQKYMEKTPTKLATGYANETLGYTSSVKFMQSGISVPETGYADRAFGYSTERPYDGPGSPYSGGYAPEATFGRPVGDDYDYPPRGAYDRPAIPGDDEFDYPPRGTYERPLRPADDDYSYPARPVRPAEDDYRYPARPVRTMEDDYRYPSEGASRRRHGTDDLYVRAEDDPYDRYGGERRQSYDSRDDDRRRDDRRRPDRESYEMEHERRGKYVEGSSYEDSSRYPAKYPSEYPGSGGNYGVYPETGERYGPDYSLTGDYGYSGKPHHTPLKNKSLPIEMLTDILSRRTGLNVRLGNIHRTLYDLFGDDASPTVKFFVNLLYNKMEDNGGEGGGHGHGLMGKIGGLASQLLKTKLDHPEEEFERYRRRHRRNYDAGILITACEPYETSADANPTNNPRDAYGALSNAIQTIIGESRGPLTNRQLVMAARKLLSQQGYKQHPCLYCSDRNADVLFLTPM